MTRCRSAGTPELRISMGDRKTPQSCLALDSALCFLVWVLVPPHSRPWPLSRKQHATNRPDTSSYHRSHWQPSLHSIWSSCRLSQTWSSRWSLFSFQEEMVSDYFMLRLMCLLWSPTLCAWNPYFLRIHLLSLYRAHLWLLWCRLLVRFRGWCGKKQGDVRGRRHILREELKLLKIAGVCHHPKTNWQGSGRSRA